MSGDLNLKEEVNFLKRKTMKKKPKGNPVD